MPELEYLTAEIIRFRDERDRGQFHTPRILATAVAVAVTSADHLVLTLFRID